MNSGNEKARETSRAEAYVTIPRSVVEYVLHRLTPIGRDSEVYRVLAAALYAGGQEEIQAGETGTQRPPLTEEDLKQIQARADRADKGPWWVEGIGGVHMDGTRDGYMVRAPGVHMADFLIRFRRGANADFVAHAREDVPNLIETVRYWRGRAERAEAIVQRVREFVRTLGD